MMSARVRPLAALISVCGLAACATQNPPFPNEAPPWRVEAPTPPAEDILAAPRIIWPDRPIQCVPFARERSGVSIRGDAHTWWSQAEGRYQRATTPRPGAVMVLANYAGPDRGHVAVVTHIVSDREVLVDHANWHNRGEVALDVPVRDESLTGDWSRVRVFHVLNQSWGSRLYEVQGFILPG